MNIFSINKKILEIKQKIVEREGILNGTPRTLNYDLETKSLKAELSRLRTKRYFTLHLLTIGASWALVIATLIVTIPYQIEEMRVQKANQQANVIFSSSDITITPNISLEGNIPGDMLTPLISNIGKSPAENINFKIYLIRPVTTSTFNVSQLFNESLVTNLQPGEKIKFGAFETSYKSCAGMNLIGTLTGIIFHLSYIDGLTKEKKNSVFMYHYILGEKDPINGFFSFLQSDYKGIYNVLLENITTTTDAYLYQYLRDNPPE